MKSIDINLLVEQGIKQREISSENYDMWWKSLDSESKLALKNTISSITISDKIVERWIENSIIYFHNNSCEENTIDPNIERRINLEKFELQEQPLKQQWKNKFIEQEWRNKKLRMILRNKKRDLGSKFKNWLKKLSKNEITIYKMSLTKLDKKSREKIDNIILRDLQKFQGSMNKEIYQNHRSNSLCSSNSFEQDNEVTQERASVIVVNPQYQILVEQSHQRLTENNTNNQEELIPYF